MGLSLLKVTPELNGTQLSYSGVGARAAGCEFKTVLPGAKQTEEKENLRDSSKCPEMKHLFVVGFVVPNSTSVP